MKILAMDIETTEFKEGEIPNITVASTVTSDEEKIAWFSHPTNLDIHNMVSHDKNETWESFSPDGELSQVMSSETCLHMLNYIKRKQDDGYMIVAWNGAGFDFRILGHAANNLSLSGNIVLKMYDPMYQFLSKTGYPVGLAAVAKGMQIDQGKTMDGKDAPQAWVNREFHKVINYVIGDSEITLKIVREIITKQEVKWITGKGSLKKLRIPQPQSVAECLIAPPVDQSWQTTPLNKKEIVSWIASNAVDMDETTNTENKIEPPVANQDMESKTNEPNTLDFANLLVGENNSLGNNKPILIVLCNESSTSNGFIAKAIIKGEFGINLSKKITTKEINNSDESYCCYDIVSKSDYEDIVAVNGFICHNEQDGDGFGIGRTDISSMLAKRKDVAVFATKEETLAVSEFMSNLPEKTKTRFNFVKLIITEDKNNSDKAFDYIVVNKHPLIMCQTILSIIIANKCRN